MKIEVNEEFTSLHATQLGTKLSSLCCARETDNFRKSPYLRGIQCGIFVCVLERGSGCSGAGRSAAAFSRPASALRPPHSALCPAAGQHDRFLIGLARGGA